MHSHWLIRSKAPAISRARLLSAPNQRAVSAHANDSGNVSLLPRASGSGQRRVCNGAASQNPSRSQPCRTSFEPRAQRIARCSNCDEGLGEYHSDIEAKASVSSFEGSTAPRLFGAPARYREGAGERSDRGFDRSQQTRGLRGSER